MSRGKTKTNTTSNFSNTQTLNPWSQNKFEGQFDKIQGMMDDNPVQAYSGNMVAGLSGREQQARGLFEQNMGSFNPGFDEAEGMIRGAGFNPQALGTGTQADFGGVADQYMNPYQSQVIDTLRTQSNDGLQANLAAQKERSLRNRAYGGSGNQVSEGIATAEAQKGLDAQVAGLLYQGYNDSRGYYGSDLDRTDNRTMYGNQQQQQGAQWDAQRGGLLAGLASDRHNMGRADAFDMNEFGEVDRGIEQDRMGADYNEFLRQQDEQTRRIGIQTGLLGSIPMLTNSSGTQSSNSTQTTNPGLIGTLGQLGGMASMFAPGGQMGGLLSGGMMTRREDNMSLMNNYNRFRSGQ